MKKEIRDGKVAVLVSPGFGAGWSTWNGIKELIFHPEIVKLVEQERYEEITEEFCQELLNTDDYICVLGVNDLTIAWLDEGTHFIINEYDGYESIYTVDDLTLIA